MNSDIDENAPQAEEVRAKKRKPVVADTPPRPQPSDDGYGIVDGVLDTITIDPDLIGVAGRGLGAAAEGLAQLASGAAEVAGHVLSGAAEAVGDMLGSLLD